MGRRCAGAPLTKTFHVYFSKLKRSIIKNNSSSLYNLTTSCRNANIISSNTSQDFTSDVQTNIPFDFKAVFASRRFFFTSPGRSNSIVESKCHEKVTHEEDNALVMIEGGIPILAYSFDPFIDFRFSMQEMVEASNVLNVRSVDQYQHNGDYLHELVLSYLALNTENTHTFIVDAFVDLLISLVTTSSSPGVLE